MSERYDRSLKDKDGNVLEVIVSDNDAFGLVRISNGRDDITMTISEFIYLSNWVLKKR